MNREFYFNQMADVVRSVGEEIVRSGTAPAFAAVVGLANSCSRQTVTLGVLDQASAPVPQPVREDTLFDIASLTKVVSTWAVAGAMFKNGRIDLDETIGELLEQDGPSAGVTVREVLTHTTGLSASTWLSQYDVHEGANSIITSMLKEPWAGSTSDAHYLNRGFILLGAGLESRAKESLADLAARYVWQPLGMYRTSYRSVHPTTDLNIAPTEWSESAGSHLVGVVHDENARVLGGVAGHAGVFSCLRDLEAFAAGFYNGSIENIVGSDWLRLSQELVAPWGAPERFRSLGWAVRKVGAGEVLYHDGFTGVSLFLCPALQAYVVMLTNSVYTSRRAPGIVAARERIISALLQA